MRILLTGGGSGGHFYPLIAIAERIKTLSHERKLAQVELYYMSDIPYDMNVLSSNEITFIPVLTGKLRKYFSLKNFTDMFKVFIGVIQATIKLFFIYPDVIISKGGHGSFPALFAGRILNIPIIIHESDSYPGRVSIWSGKFARNIALSYDDAKEFFDKSKTAVVGLPIRNELTHLPTPEEGAEYYKLDKHLPTIFIYGGSQGAEKINNLVLESLSELLKSFQIIHQCGSKNEEVVKMRTSVILESHPYKNRYIIKPFMNVIDTRNAAALSSLVVSRAGSTLFEIANWHIPAIVIPITHSNGNHQHKNAIRYAQIGAGIVIEESNALPHIFISKVNEILMSKDTWQKMHNNTLEISKIDAAMEIARQAILISESHEI